MNGNKRAKIVKDGSFYDRYIKEILACVSCLPIEIVTLLVTEYCAKNIYWGTHFYLVYDPRERKMKWKFICSKPYDYRYVYDQNRIHGFQFGHYPSKFFETTTYHINKNESTKCSMIPQESPTVPFVFQNQLMIMSRNLEMSSFVFECYQYHEEKQDWIYQNKISVAANDMAEKPKCSIILNGKDRLFIMEYCTSYSAYPVSQEYNCEFYTINFVTKKAISVMLPCRDVPNSSVMLNNDYLLVFPHKDKNKDIYLFDISTREPKPCSYKLPIKMNVVLSHVFEDGSLLVANYFSAWILPNARSLFLSFSSLILDWITLPGFPDTGMSLLCFD